ncbi:MAG: ABC transporter ATP-binding protein [Planctomycetota bacterium]
MNPPRLFGGERRALFLRIAGAGIVQASSAVALMLLARAAFDGALDPGEAPPSLAPLGLAMTCAMALNAASRWGERVWAERLGQDYLVELRVALFRHLTGLEPRLLLARSRGGMLLRFLGDLTPLRLWVSLGIARVVVGGTTVVATSAFLALQSPLLAGCVLGAMAVGVAASSLLGPQLEHTVRSARRSRTRLATNVGEKLATMPVVQAYNRGGKERRRVARQSERLKHAMIEKARAIGSLRVVAQATVGVASIAVLVAGSHQIRTGDATPGTVLAATMLVGVLAPSVRELARVFEYWQSARVSFEKIRAVAELPAFYHRDEQAREIPAPRGEIGLRGVAVDGLFENVTATARAGAKVAVVGPNGAGKSTLLWLIARLLDPQSGEVTLDGVDLREARPRDVRKAMGVVSPDLPLQTGSVAKNLRYRRPGATAEEVTEAIERSAAAAVLAELPRGQRTRISEGGANLSIGQRRRIALARAALGAPAVLLLDEVEANLDAGSRAAYRKVLLDYPGTVLFATHDRELAELADEVWQLDGGELRVRRGARASGVKGG